MSESLIESIGKVRMLVMDVDGVLTDGRVFLNSKGEWTRLFSVRDGVGLYQIQSKGYRTGIITGGSSGDVVLRAQYLKVDHFFNGRLDKKPAFDELQHDSGLKPHEMAYVGDEIFDIPLLRSVGFSATVPEAVDEVKKECDYVTKRSGGYGAVREVCQLILEYGSLN